MEESTATESSQPQPAATDHQDETNTPAHLNQPVQGDSQRDLENFDHQGDIQEGDGNQGDRESGETLRLSEQLPSEQMSDSHNFSISRPKESSVTPWAVVVFDKLSCLSGGIINKRDLTEMNSPVLNVFVHVLGFFQVVLKPFFVWIREQADCDDGTREDTTRDKSAPRHAPHNEEALEHFTRDEGTRELATRGESIQELTLDDRRDACATTGNDGLSCALPDYGESLCDHARHQRNEQPVSRNQGENILSPAEIAVHGHPNEMGLEFAEFEIKIHEAGL